MIEVDMDAYSEDALFSDFDYVKLETTDSCLLNYIEKIVVNNDTLIIQSIHDRLVALFSLTGGRFIYRFPLGNGPNELRYPVDVALDDLTGNLWILDSYKFFQRVYC